MITAFFESRLLFNIDCIKRFISWLSAARAVLLVSLENIFASGRLVNIGACTTSYWWAACAVIYDSFALTHAPTDQPQLAAGDAMSK